MGDSCKLCCYCWIDSLQVVTMEDMMRERIQQSWKIQTFQYDYLAHLKGRFILCHFLLFAFSWILMCVLHDSFLLTQIMCMASWDYFVLFDKKRRTDKDPYIPQRYEYVGTLITTIGFGVMILLVILL